MTIYEAILELKSENGYYANNGMTDVAEFNTNIIRWLEELKVLRHGANELRNAGYEHGRSVGYRNAIDDFVNACEKQFTTMYGQRYVDMRDIVNIAEQLKAGGENDNLRR